MRHPVAEGRNPRAGRMGLEFAGVCDPSRSGVHSTRAGADDRFGRAARRPNMSQGMMASTRTAALTGPEGRGGPSRWESSAPIRYPDLECALGVGRIMRLI
jgi:hypothetical protein